MKIHLIKSKEVDIELYSKIVDLLRAIPGPLNFCWNPLDIINIEEEERIRKNVLKKEDFEFKAQMFTENFSSKKNYAFPLEREEVSWSLLFGKCNDFRKRNKIDPSEFVFILTDIANNKNWFAAVDESNPFNGFVHTADWDYYINCSSAFPVAYEVIALILQKHMFNGARSLRLSVHDSPIGCINDLCIQKKEIILKLRTADVCHDCMELLKGKISMPELHHALNIMNSLREKMLFAQNFKQSSAPGRLRIDIFKKIHLPDFGNMEIKLRPLEKALYFLFLKHPEGIYHSGLSDHREELYEIYSHIANMGDLNEMKDRIDDMVNALSDSASQKMSRIKRVFEESLGSELAKHYYIKGEPGQVKKISLDRSLVVSER